MPDTLLRVRRHFQMPVELRAVPDATETGNVVSGYAAVYYDAADPNTRFQLWDNCFEYIAPGAFDKALARPDDVRCLFNHDPSQIIGRNLAETLSLRVDAKGLFFECQLPDSAPGKTVAEAVRRKDVTGCSFCFDCVCNWIEDSTGPALVTYRVITDVVLYDVGPVTFPAYPATDCDSDRAKRSLDEFRKNRPTPQVDQLMRRLRSIC